MMSEYLSSLFSLEGKTAIITGGTGVLGSAMSRGLASAGAKVGILGRRQEQAESIATQICDSGGEAVALPADVLETDQLKRSRDLVMDRWGRIDILINAAGGNFPKATVAPGQHVFDVPRDALEQVLDLNWMGTILPCQIFGSVMAQQKEGSIINVSSMAVGPALSRVIGYSSAKAAIDNLTRWLAVDLAQKYGPGLRVNAVAPGFFIGDQNRSLLLNEDNTLTARGQLIINHTPAASFGKPDELVGTVIWLCSPAAKFVNGVVVAVDGGFSAFSGV
jgi:NAD(P)-dependent dehydrogenase (short-subunit alcohol dehydrogenase family)